MTGTEPTDHAQSQHALEDRLARTFAQQATTVAPEPAPLPTILERSRRRRARRHTAMALAGVLILTLTSAVVLTRVRDDVGISIDSTYGSGGTGAAREGSGNEVPASFGDDGSVDGWSTSLPRIGLDLPGAQVIGAVGSSGTDASSSADDNIHQRYRVDPNDLGSPTLDLTASRMVPISATIVAAMAGPDAVPIRIQGRDGRISTTRDPGSTEVLWLAEDGRLMQLTATGIAQDEVVATAQKLTPRGDGGFTFPPLLHGLVPVIDQKGSNGRRASSATTYTVAQGMVVLNVMQGSRGDFDDLASHGPAWHYEYRNIFGYRGVIASKVEAPSTAVVPVGPDGSQVVSSDGLSVDAIWYEPDHDAIVDVQLRSASARLDDVVAHLVRVDESTYRSFEHSAGTSVPAFPGPSVVVPSPSVPIAPGDGTSSPWINASPTTAPAPTFPGDPSTPTTAPGPGESGDSGATSTTEPGPGGDATATTSSIVLQHEPYGPPTTPGP